jgi:hypothetical protein
MARQTPIEILVDPIPNVESQIYHIIDTRVEYDFPTNEIEVNVPSLSVQEGNLVNIPVKVLTGGLELSALQFGVEYNDTLLEFRGAYASANATKWISFINANGGRVDWGGYDNTNNENPLVDGDSVITLQFAALKPQLQWEISPLWTSDKFAGQNGSNRDLEITPTGGIIQVLKTSNNVIIVDGNQMEVYPNPVKDEVTIIFNVTQMTDASLVIKVTIIFNVTQMTDASLVINDLQGRKVLNILNGTIPEGQFEYKTNLGKLAQGFYIATLSLENGGVIAEKIIKQ